MMKDHEIILKMIEDVSPDDTAKLDEIDARVWCFLNNKKLGEKRFYSFDDRPGKIPYWVSTDGKEINYIQNYTRSRDALKAIRPEGWKFLCGQSMQDGQNFCVCQKIGDESHIDNENSILLTEELAELHAIIQAIAYERSENDGN